MTKKEKERQELKELWDKVTFKVEPKKTTVIGASKITTYKADQEDKKWTNILKTKLLNIYFFC